VASLGWRRGALTLDGAAAAAGIGASTFVFGGLRASLSLIAFFVSGSALSRRKAVAGEVAAVKGHRRDAVQVLANGGVAAAALALGGAGWRRAESAALGALAAAAADTWASEVGVRSSSPPRSVVTGELMLPGASGGVTPLGWGAAAGGALVVGAVWALASRPSERNGRSGRVLGVALVAGLVGSLADSVAGATIQGSYQCAACQAVAESPGLHCGVPVQLVRGYSWITNDVVNGIGTVAGALTGAWADARLKRGGGRRRLGGAD